METESLLQPGVPRADAAGVPPGPAPGTEPLALGTESPGPSTEPLALGTESPGPGTESPGWADRASAFATAFLEWLSQPRLRLAVVGVILLVIGGLFMTSSVWTLPLVVVGALMVAIAWIGCRLDGRFAVEWGQTGTQLEFRAKIRAPQLPRAGAARPPARTLARAAEPPPERAGVIDGEAHTVEIDVAELEALIAAVETQGGETRQPAASETAAPDFRVARGGTRASEAAR